MQIISAMFGFKSPPVATILFIMFVGVMTLALLPYAGIEKLGFTLAVGLGTGYLTNATKALGAGADRIAVWMVGMGVILVVTSILFTPDSVFVGSVLDEIGTVLLGAMLGLAAKVEEA